MGDTHRDIYTHTHARTRARAHTHTHTHTHTHRETGDLIRVFSFLESRLKTM
jgi:hypothetical protein